jgi:competence protein ComEA
VNHNLKTGLAFGLAAAVLFLSLGGVGVAGDQKGKVNINTAAASELENLPRIGPKVAERIVEFRTKNGDFKRIEDIMKVQGIGEKVFEQIKDLITVGPDKREN